jgi:protein-S-isoprenylcysteine O-methyltransferase Ste14
MLVRIGNFLFHWRNFLFPVPFLLVFLPGRPIYADPVCAALVGGAIALAGQLVRAGTIGFKYIIRGGKDRRVYAEDLITEGIYAHTRNPMYVGNVLILSGVGFAVNTWACWLLATALGVFVYVAIIAAEENFLRGKFGPGFDDYCRDVPRWLPRLSGLGTTLSSGTFKWRRVIVKEYGTPFGWVLGICAVLVWNLSRLEGGLSAHLAEMRGVHVTVLVAVALYVLARVLKKTKLLVAD